MYLFSKPFLRFQLEGCSLNQYRTQCCSLLIPIGLILSAFSPNVYSVDGSIAQKQQKNALDMIDRVSGSEKGNQLKKDLNKVFDHYDKINEQGKGVIVTSKNSQLKGTGVLEAAGTASVENNSFQPQNLAIQSQTGINFEAESTLGLNRDPFSVPPGLMRQVVSKQSKQSKQGLTASKPLKPQYSFTRLKTGVKVPKLTLKGLILKSEEEKAAVLQVGRFGTYIVREGDTISIPDGPKNNVIKVTKIDRLSLLIEVGKLGEVIIVR